MRACSIAPILFVADIDRSIAYYTEKLGFRERFRYGTYAGVYRDEITLHLTQPDVPHAKPAGSASVYIFVEGVDKFYTYVQTTDAEVLGEPQDYP